MTSSRSKLFRRGTAATVAAGLVLVTPAVAMADRAPARGTLVGNPVLVQRVKKADMPSALGPFDARQVKFGVDAYRLTYRTVDVYGKPTTATGLVALPDTTGSLPIVSYEHGTRTGREEVASVTAGTPDRPAVLLIASAGYAAVAPDYLGLGEGPGFHPYMNARSETTAAVDMLRAAKAFADQRHRKLEPDVLATGFSQGGPAAMALGKALQSGVDPRFRLKAVAPLSGPLDAQHAELPAAIDTGGIDGPSASLYLAYWTVSANRVHRIYHDPSEIFLGSYAKTTEALFDGESSEEAILQALPDSPEKLFTPAFLQRLRHPDGGLLDAIKATDGTCSTWRPSVPVRLFAASGDRDVAIANSLHCQRDLRAHGVGAPLTELGRLTHFESWFAGVPEVLDWFAGLR